MRTKQKLGLLERAIKAVLPQTAANRAFYRARTEHFRLMETSRDYRENFFALMGARGYRAADTSRNKTPWLGGRQTADQEVINSLPALINRSRELNRDDPIAGGTTGTFVRNIIGTGMRAQARTGDPEKNKRLEAVWKERKDSLTPGDDVTYGKHQELVLRKVLEDGGVFVKESRAEDGEPVWFEIIEKDRVRMPVGITTADLEDPKGRIVEGVEKDHYGRPIAYWIAKLKYINVVTITGAVATSLALTREDFDRVPKENIRHPRIIERPGQTHGVPLFHAILQDLRDLDLLILAALKRTQIAACLAVFIESPVELASLIDGTAQKYHFQLDKDLEPGMITKLYPGEKISSLIPNFPTTEFGPFIITLARRIGASLGISWQMVLKDFSKANYSSARTDLLESRQVFVGFQSWLIEKVFNWEWTTVMRDAKLRDDKRLAGVTPEDLSAVHWIPNGWRWVDPVKESQATQLKLQMGLTTLRDECAAQGKDWEEVMEQRLQEELTEINRRKELKLPPPTRIVVLPPKKKGALKTGIEDEDQAFHLSDRFGGRVDMEGEGGNGEH